VTLSAVIVALFFGGWSIPWLPFNELQGLIWSTPLDPGWGALLATWIALTVFVAKMMFFIWVQMLIRWSFPRFRYDQLMDLGWKILLPLSLANVVFTAVAVVLDPTLRAALVIGLIEVVILAGFVLSVRAPRRSDPIVS